MASRGTSARILTAALLAGAGSPRTGASATPPAVPPPATDPLAWTVGRWEGERIESASSARAPLRTEVEAVLGGAGEEERIEVGEPGKLYRGLYLQVFDPSLKKSVLIYVNANRREFARLEGMAQDGRAEWVSTTARAPRGSRLTYERLDPDRWRRTQWVSEDSGSHWTVLFVDEMRRLPDGRTTRKKGES